LIQEELLQQEEEEEQALRVASNPSFDRAMGSHIALTGTASPIVEATTSFLR